MTPPLYIHMLSSQIFATRKRARSVQWMFLSKLASSAPGAAHVRRRHSIRLCPLLLLAACQTAFPSPADGPVPDPASSSAQAASPYQPLTASERWHRYWRETLLGPSLIGAAAGAARWAEITREPPEWREGVSGWAKRSLYWTGVIATQATIRQGADAALGYDPRYQKCDCKGFFRRSGHAMLWTFFTRDSAGDTRFDVGSLAGAYGSGMLSMLWYPRRYSPLKDGFRAGTQEVGLTVGLNTFREFGPELKRAFLPRHTQ